MRQKKLWQQEACPSHVYHCYYQSQPLYHDMHHVARFLPLHHVQCCTFLHVCTFHAEAR